MKLLAVVVVLVGGFWFWQHHRRAVLQQRLGAVASELAGRPVHVHCQGFLAELIDISDRTGDVQFPDGHPADTTHLTRGICGALESFRSASSHHRLDCVRSTDWSGLSVEIVLASPCARGAQATVNAITTLAHESMHLRGWASEAQAQCYAIQDDAWTVVRLGGTAEEGAALARLALAEQPAMPSAYQSGECRASGALDLYPETPEFPTEAVPRLPPAELFGPARVR